jgi:hypothetical protein
MAGEQYYALCVQEQDGSTEIAFFELTREALPGALGISLYTSPDGELQRKHLQGNDHVVIVAKSPRDLLEAMNTGVPSSVFVDGERIAGRLYLSESTIKQHLHAVYKVLGVRNRTEAAKTMREYARGV